MGKQNGCKYLFLLAALQPVTGYIGYFYQRDQWVLCVQHKTEFLVNDEGREFYEQVPGFCQ